MGHLCSCHRQQQFDKGRLPSSTMCKSESSLLYKLHLIRGDGQSNLERKLLPPPNDSSVRQNGQETVGSQGVSTSPYMSSQLVPGDSLEGEEDVNNSLCESSFLCGQRSQISSSFVDLQSVDVASMSASFHTKMTLNESGTLPCRPSSTPALSPSSFDGAISTLTSHAVQLVLASGVQPEVVVDYLHRKHVVNEETVAAVRRCATKRFACELIVEVVASKGRTEMETFVEALRAAGSSPFADCLETINGLVNFQTVFRETSHSDISEVNRYIKYQPVDMLSCVCDNKSTNRENILHSSVSGGGQFEIEIAYIDPTSGLMIGAENCRSSVTAARTNSQRHRSLIIDPETLSLPPQFGALADSVDVLSSQDIFTLHPGIGGISVTNGGIPVVSLSLTSVCLSNQLVEKMAACLCRYPSLRILSLVKCHRTALCLERLRSLVTNRKSVSRFDCRLIRLDVRLSRDVIDIGTNSHLGSDLSRVACRSLRSLCLTGSGLTSSGSTDLFRNFVAVSRLLTELDLGFNDVTDCQPIADALAANCSLRRLRLRGNAISSDGARLIFDSLRRNYRLEDLDVSGNSFGSSVTNKSYTQSSSSITPQSTSSGSCLVDVDGQQGPVGSVGKSLAEALVCNRTLRELRAERCCLGVDECRGLARALLTNTTLTILDISSNPTIGDVGLEILSTSMSRNRRCAIEILSLNMCSISDTGLGILLTSIVGSTTRQTHTSSHRHSGDSRTRLKRIKLCYNNIQVADSTHIMQQQQQQLSCPTVVLQEHSSNCRMRYAVGEIPPSPVCESREMQSSSSCSSINTSLSQRHECSGDIHDVIVRGQSGSDVHRKVNVTSPNTPLIVKHSSTRLGNRFRVSNSHAKSTVADQPIRDTLQDKGHNEYTKNDSDLNQSWDASVSSSVFKNDKNNNSNNMNNNINTTVYTADHFISSHGDNIKRIADESDLTVYDDGFSLKSPSTFAPFARGHYLHHSDNQLMNPTNMPDNGKLLRNANVNATGVNEVRGHKPRSSTPIGPSVLELSDAGEDTRDIYQLMCQVLAANPKLKILLWGNSRLTTSYQTKSSRRLVDDVREAALDYGEEQSTDVEQEFVTSPLDRCNSASIFQSMTSHKYATLPMRTHEPREFDTKRFGF